MLYKVLVIIVGFFLRIFFRVRVHGDRELLTQEGVMICANHWHFLDPVFLAIIYKKQMHFMGKQEVFKYKSFGYIFRKLGVFAVDREGNDIRALKTAIKLLKDGKTVGVFIEGTRVKSIDLENAKPGAVMIANVAKTKILPIYISSNYKLFSKVDLYIRDIYEIPKDKLKAEGEQGYKVVAQDVLKEIYGI